MADQHVEGDTIPETDKKRLLPYSNIIDVLRPIPEQATDFAIRCRFFDAVLDGKFKESQQRGVNMPTDDPFLIARVIEWVYDGEISHQHDEGLLHELVDHASHLQSFKKPPITSTTHLPPSCLQTSIYWARSSVRAQNS
ncbi:hypothetical protein PMZ80_003960 [Knufia obscura]|uniref:BTB domain-containing protein n=1 Tax=Knufia obscura TaxID=1635080 RepID=A0ABR0RQQ8_9EURO|nr:hypothetical protein PMZ80_003960 [Knufia obscura]